MLRGRADGLYESEGIVTIEEFKCCRELPMAVRMLLSGGRTHVVEVDISSPEDFPSFARERQSIWYPGRCR